MTFERDIRGWMGALAVGFLAVAPVAPAMAQIRVEPGIQNAKAALAAAKSESILPVPKACVLQSISCGQTVTGSLTSDDCELNDGSFADFWEFNGTSGQTVTANMTSGAVDSYLLLLDPGDDVAAENDDGGGGNNARIVHALSSSGNWALVANSLNANETGTYTLSLACAGGGGGGGTPAAPSNLQATALSANQAGLSWTDNSNNETGFRIEMRQASGAFAEVGTVGANVSSATVSGLSAATSYTFRVRARNGNNNSAYSNLATVTTQAADGFNQSVFPDFRYRVRIINQGGETITGVPEPVCLPQTDCVSGALPGQAEVFLRIVGPKPNGFLWPTIIKFTTSTVEVDIRQISTGVTKSYRLEGASPGVDELPGLFDRTGFLP